MKLVERDTLVSREFMLLPFTYTAMDEACLIQAKQIDHAVCIRTKVVASQRSYRD